jgi:hypothetical protein
LLGPAPGQESHVMPHYPQYQQHNPSRPPAWRWQRANQLVESGRYYRSGRDDAETGRAIRHLRARRDTRWRRGLKVLASDPSVTEAANLWKRAGLTRWLLEARLLTPLSLLEIGRLAGLAPETVQAYEALFFNVRDRLAARDYIYVSVLKGIQLADVELLLKAVAYCVGSGALEPLLNALQNPEDTSWETQAGRLNYQLSVARLAETGPVDRVWLARITAIMKAMARSSTLRAPLAPTSIISGLASRLFLQAGSTSRPSAAQAVQGSSGGPGPETQPSAAVDNQSAPNEQDRDAA